MPLVCITSELRAQVRVLCCCDGIVRALQGNVAAELVVCHVLLGADGAAEDLLLRSESHSRTATPPSSGSQVQPVP